MTIQFAGQAARRGRAVVAIPARDEAEHLTDCLNALHEQDVRPDTVVLLLNNCQDGSETIARALRGSMGYELVVERITLPAQLATAGEARRIALAIAARIAGPDGIVMTTDADATVPRDWVSRNIAALNGADLVCGRVRLDPAGSRLIPAHLHDDDARECELIALLDEIVWLIDPDPADPWPRHTEEAGASLAMTAAALARVGGAPTCASGEDRALAQAFKRMDARVRHESRIVVTVSGRLEGRAAGGMADTIRRRIVQQDILADAQVEPAHAAERRVTLRARVRSAWSGDTGQPGLADELAIPPATLAEALGLRWFGAAWDTIQACSPVLQRQRVRFVDLAAETVIARQILGRHRQPISAAAD